jgi:hypothetical protein
VSFGKRPPLSMVRQSMSRSHAIPINRAAPRDTMTESAQSPEGTGSLHLDAAPTGSSTERTVVGSALMLPPSYEATRAPTG